jgi:EAL domain-containing protein (putative c-di-GMP-specific phosphodiesterase class I)
MFDVQHDAAVKSQFESLERIRSALKNDEFVLYFQPKVNMHTGQVVGAEALIRWQHPERGLLSPGAFLPLVDGRPIEIDIGEWVLDTALNEVETWQAQGLEIPVSINISAGQLQRADFPSVLRQKLLARPSLRPSMIELEILESSALEDIEQVTQVMLACRELGVRFALDDFGTGYSSLTYFKRLPTDVIKIDQSFISDILDNPDELAVLEGIIDLTGTFGRTVIAEGVEVTAQGELLLILGCELAQGYGIAQPMPAEDLPNWTATWKPDQAWTRPSIRSHAANALVPLLYGIVNVRSWVRQLESSLASELPAQVPPGAHHCRFGTWLDSQVSNGWNRYPEFKALMDIHNKLHDLGEALAAEHAHGDRAAARAGLPQLQEIRDQLTAQLRSLIDVVEMPFGKEDMAQNH